MVKTNLIIWGYFLLFFSIYLGSIAYGALPVVFHDNDVVDSLPQTEYTQAVNATVSLAAMGSAQSTVFAGFALVAVGIIVLAFYGMVSTFNGY